MKNLVLIIPLLGLLTACQNSGARLYQARTMPGLTSPFTANCTSIRLLAGDGDKTLNQSDFSKYFFGQPNPGPTTVTAECFAMVDGKLTQTGSSTARINANAIEIYIGSSEGSSIADTFARTATVSGVFPIIQAP